MWMSTRERNSDQPESSQEEALATNRREPRIPDPTLRDYFDKNKHVTNHRGHVDECKLSEKMRTLTMNVHGCRPENNERLQTIRTSIEKDQIGISLFNKANAKWNTLNVNRVGKEMKKMDRGVQLMTADSKQWEVTKNNYLPGGLLNAIGSKCASVITVKKITIGKWEIG